MWRGSCPFSWCYSLCSRQEASQTPFRAAVGSGAHQRSYLGTCAFSAWRHGGTNCCPRLSLTPHSGGNGLAGLRGTVLWLLSACFNSASRGTTSRAPGPQPLRGSPQQPHEAAHSRCPVCQEGLSQGPALAWLRCGCLSSPVHFNLTEEKGNLVPPESGLQVAVSLG